MKQSSTISSTQFGVQLVISLPRIHTVTIVILVILILSDHYFNINY